MLEHVCCTQFTVTKGKISSHREVKSETDINHWSVVNSAVWFFHFYFYDWQRIANVVTCDAEMGHAANQQEYVPQSYLYGNSKPR